MHPQRQHILYRSIALLVLLVAGAVGFNYVNIKAMVPRYSVPEAPPIPDMTLPEDSNKAKIVSAIEALNNLAVQQAERSAAYPRMELVDISPLQRQQNELARELAGSGPVFKGPEVGMIIMSQGKPRALIDGKLYTVGQELPDGRVVHKIDNEGVVLEAEGQTERVTWQHPMRVELKKSQGLMTTRSGGDEGLGEDGADEAGAEETGEEAADNPAAQIQQATEMTQNLDVQ